jgi:hypothetical protein
MLEHTLTTRWLRVAVTSHEFLVVERDNRSWLSAEPQAPTRKWIYKIDVSGATDVSGRVLPSTTLPSDVRPVQKQLFIDLLEPAFGLQNNDARAIAEKIEGLAWGPPLPDGRHLLYVVSDNDLVPSRPTQIFAFAIDETKLATPVSFEEQFLPGPLYPPGQVKKPLGQ